MNVTPLIAVVDDDPAIRTGLSSLLRAAGYAVQVFGRAADLLAALPACGPDCVLTDVQMPDLSGLDLQSALALRAPETPVIVMTAFPEPAVRDRALAAGATCFLAKPCEAEQLLGCIRKALSATGA